jgi:RimJ/RimL family protein N-acetyltransferase
MPLPLSDGTVTIRSPEPGDGDRIVAARDPEFHRWLGPGSAAPRPTACIVVDGEVVGWVDYDRNADWLGTDEVNIGYHLFASARGRSYASRAVRLLLTHLATDTPYRTASLLIDAENHASLRVARSVGARAAGRWDTDGGRQQLRYVIDI